jgi:ubiquinone/menaquinone biosynthesis C-methylase UbiE
MIRQRRGGGAPVVRAVAEHLPIRANAVDAALAVLTIHHWSDVDAGVAEMIRVARRRIVILTWDHTVFRHFWLLLGNASIQKVPIPYDCADGGT